MSTAPLDPATLTNGGPRVATPDDATTVTALLVDAFAADPFWGAGAWAFQGHPAARKLREAVFRLIVDGALRYPWVWLHAGETASSVWIPPGGAELSKEQEATLEALLCSALGSAASRLLRSFELFDAAWPRADHYFLSLLGTHPDHSGHRHGQNLLSAYLALLDAEGAPAYLDCADERVPLYQRYGFRRTGSFVLPDGPTVNTMWRPAAAVRISNPR